MSQTQYAIMRFAKYKGPEISNIEAHNERTKEKYASNPDIDCSRSKYNFHLIEPAGRDRAEAEWQIQAAGCRTRTDSVLVVEVLFTATPEFFKGKKLPEVRRYFEEALRFFEQFQSRETIISAVVHMDEKTPHMHLSFVPLTTDGRLSAKEIVGNKKKLTWWQDKFWEHMVQKYPDLERGESASQTGRDHIPPRIFKEMTRLNKQRQKLDELLTGIGPLNSKKRAAEISKLLDGYIPAVEKMHTQLSKYGVAFTQTKTENKRRPPSWSNLWKPPPRPAFSRNCEMYSSSVTMKMHWHCWNGYRKRFWSSSGSPKPPSVLPNFESRKGECQ